MTDKLITWDFSDLMKGLEEYGRFAAKTFEDAAKEIGMDGLGRMIERAPIKTGMLRGSGSVHVNNRPLGKGLSQEMGRTRGTPVTESLGPKPKQETIIVWGFNTHYAAKVHENSSSPKYVENILKERMEIWMKHLADRLKESKGGKSK